MALHFTVKSRDVCMNMPWFEDFWSFGFREQVISSDAANRSSDSSEWGFPCAEVTKAVQLAARYGDQFWQNIFQTFFKGTLKGHSMFGHRYFMLNLTCWVLQPEHLCRFHPFTTCDRFESLPGRLSRDLGSAALRFAQKLLCWTVTFHRVNCFF